MQPGGNVTTLKGAIKGCRAAAEPKGPPTYEPTWGTRKYSEALRQSGRDRCDVTGKHDDLGANRDATIQIRHISIGQTDAAAGHSGPDRCRRICTVNPVNRAAEIYGTCAERITFAPRHP